MQTKTKTSIFCLLILFFFGFSAWSIYDVYRAHHTQFVSVKAKTEHAAGDGMTWVFPYQDVTPGDILTLTVTYEQDGKPIYLGCDVLRQTETIQVTKPWLRVKVTTDLNPEDVYIEDQTPIQPKKVKANIHIEETT